MTHRLELPQRCTSQEQDRRRREVDEARTDYEFDHGWEGYPPSIRNLPLREMPPKGVLKLVESGIKLELSKIEQWINRVLNDVEHMGGSVPPFEPYTALYESGTLPPIAQDDRWQLDAVFAAQRLNGMYPWFIERVRDLAKLQRDFPITDAMLEGVLPKGTTLSELEAAGRLYFVSQPSLAGAPPAHDHVMTAPTTLFYVSALGQLLPLAIQLQPKTSDTNPIFTPAGDPNTWLAVKIHAACADTLVHSIYSHAILMHFVMCNVWTAANRTLPAEHPIHAFLKPHFWSTLFVTNAVKSSMDSESGAQCEVYGTGLAGQNEMVSRLYRSFDFRDYVPHVDFARRGVDDAEALPDFHYREDALRLWQADRDYVEAMMGLFYGGDGDVAGDYELQRFMEEMASPQGAGITGLPTNAEGRIETLDQLRDFLTCVLFCVTSRHSSIENGALAYLYVPANPFTFGLEPPTRSGAKMSPSDVAKRLPSLSMAIKGYALIATADFDPLDFGLLGRYDDDFMRGAPPGVDAIVAKWQAALAQIDTEIDSRNKKLETPYTGMKPTKTFNSIWN